MAAPCSDPLRALLTPDALADPAPIYHALRATAPVYWHDGIQSWVLSTHRDCVAVLRDTTRFGSDWRRAGEDVPPQLLSIQSLDPPEHTAVRQLFLAALREVDHPQLAARVLGWVRDRTARLAGQPFDAVTELAEPLALDAVCAVLGVPAPDLAWFRPMSAAVVDAMDAGLEPDRLEPGLTARAELAGLAERWLVDPPDRGVIGFLARRAEAWQVPPMVVHNSVRTVLHAGFESTSRLLALSMAAVSARPTALAEIAASGPDRAVDELVRITSPVQADARVCLADTDIGGTTLRAGQPVTLLLAAANRDPNRFPDPDTMRFGRHPNPHLGFGRGAHACLGTALATMLAHTLFGALAARYPNLTATGSPTYRRNATLRGVERLDVLME